MLSLVLIVHPLFSSVHPLAQSVHPFITAVIQSYMSHQTSSCFLPKIKEESAYKAVQHCFCYLGWNIVNFDKRFQTLATTFAFLCVVGLSQRIGVAQYSKSNASAEINIALNRPSRCSGSGGLQFPKLHKHAGIRSNVYVPMFTSHSKVNTKM